ncbi:MAG: GFA family protein [Devosia sp.]
MPQSSGPYTGGCQCGAVRFSAARLGGAAVCHCRMCQKAFGSFFAALVTGYDVAWTRGQPGWFQSSDVVRRGFCAQCGTPLAYDTGSADGGIELAIGALDNPEWAPPSRHLNPHDMLSFSLHLAELPVQPATTRPFVEQRKGAQVVSHQHPDHDTEIWPPKDGFAA